MEGDTVDPGQHLISIDENKLDHAIIMQSQVKSSEATKKASTDGYRTKSLF